jgi:hypothetical protein
LRSVLDFKQPKPDESAPARRAPTGAKVLMRVGAHLRRHQPNGLEPKPKASLQDIRATTDCQPASELERLGPPSPRPNESYGSDTLRNIELFKFSDVTLTRAELISELTPPQFTAGAVVPFELEPPSAHRCGSRRRRPDRETTSRSPAARANADTLL